MNRFNQLLGPQQYVSTYVPLPLDFIAQQGAMRQKQYDMGMNDFDATAETIKINADPHRREIRDQLLQKYNTEITDLADQYTKTGDQSLVYKVNDLKRRFANDQVRLGLESSYANYNQLQKDSEAYKKDSKYDDIYNSYLSDTPVDESGKFRPFDYTGMLTKQDYYTKADKIMSGIAKDGSAWDGFNINKQTGLPDIGQYGEYWKTSSSGKGVKLPKVIKVAQENADVFLNTDEGRYFIDELIGKPVDYKSLNDNQKDILKKEATDYLLHIGAKQAGWESSSGNDIKWLDKDQMGRVGLDTPPMSGTTAPGATTDNNISIGNINIKEVVTADGKVDWDKLRNLDPKYSGLTALLFGSQAKGPDEQAITKIATIAKANGWDKDANGQPLSGSKVVENTLLSLQNMNVSSGSIYQPTTNAAKAYGQKMITEFDKDMMKTADKKSFTEIYSELGPKTTVNFQGFDFTDKNQPRMKVQFMDASGNITSQSFTIPNNDYNAKLAPISRLVGNTQEKIMKPELRTTDDIQRASLNLVKAFSLAPDQIRSVMGINGIGDLYPIGREYLQDGSEVYTFSDKNNPGNVKALVLSATDGQYHPAPSLSEVIIDEGNSFLNNPQGVENANKVEKKVPYTQR